MVIQAKNVIKVIKELEKWKDVYSVEPNYIESLDSSIDDFLDANGD